MTISRRPRLEPIFDTPVVQQFEDVDGEDLPSKEELAAQRVEELEKLLRESREREELRQEQILLSQPQQFHSQVVDVEVKPESIPLPDPAVDPEGFAAAMERRTEIKLENRARKEAASRKRDEDIDEKIENLWTDFGRAFPDIAGDKKRIEFAAQQVISAATKRGIDINRYMFTTQGKFFKDVAKEYDEVFGAIDTGYEDDYDDAPAPTSRRRTSSRNRSEDDDVGRTAGLFGGGPGGRRTSKKKDDEDDAGSMIDELQKIQRSGGFY